MVRGKNDIEDIKKGVSEGGADYIGKRLKVDILKVGMNKIVKWKEEWDRKFCIGDIGVSEMR